MADHGAPAVIDFSLFAVNKEEGNLSDEELRPLAKQLLNSLSETGFAYLLNHGIQKHGIEVTKDTVKTFFALPLETKKKYVFPDGLPASKRHGYSPPYTENVGGLMGKEGLAADILEGLHVRPLEQVEWPDEEINGFRSTLTTFFNLCGLLSLRISKLLGIGLNLQDTQALMKLHRFTEDQDPSNLKLTHYFPIPEGVATDRMRLGEHTDLSTFTLVFQEDIGGLEYQTRSGTWLPLPPIPDSVVINSGEVIEMLSAGKIPPVLHRVAFPTDPAQRMLSRFSMLYFALPDFGTVLTCLDGSNKYEPTTYTGIAERRLPAFFKSISEKNRVSNTK